MAKKAGKKTATSSASGDGDGNGTAASSAPSKTAVAKQYILANPNAGNKEVLTALEGKVPTLTYADVANARSMLTKKAAKRKKSAVKAPATAASRANGSGGDLLAVAQQAIQFAHTAGGIDRAINLLQTLQAIRAM